jgi:hypothetical protein
MALALYWKVGVMWIKNGGFSPGRGMGDTEVYLSHVEITKNLTTNKAKSQPSLDQVVKNQGALNQVLGFFFSESSFKRTTCSPLLSPHCLSQSWMTVSPN